MSYCPKNKLLNLLKRGSKFVQKASNSAAPTSTPGQASSSVVAISSTLAMDDLHTLKTRFCIIGRFLDGIHDIELMDRCRKQSLRFGTQILTETIKKVDFSTTPFKVFTDSKTIIANSIIVATGAVAKRLDFPGSGEGLGGFWNRRISTCAVCDGATPIFKNRPLEVIRGGDSAMEEAIFLTKYGSIKVLTNPKIQVLWNSVVVGAYGYENTNYRVLGGLKVKNVLSGEISDLKVSGLFFAIGHKPATKFLDGQTKLDSGGYVVTKPRTTQTSVPGVFATGDVQDKKYR
ncbi:hypothetical protein ACB092_05G214500 [Castanea dentata]